MKFTNGYWMERAGLESCYATQVVEIEKQGSELVVYAATRITKSRGDTLNAPLLTIRYSSPMKNIIKVRISHFEGALDRGPAFETSKERAFKPEIELASEGASLKTGDLEVCLEKKESWMVRYFGNQKPLTKNETKSTAYLRLDGASFVKEELALGVAECVYGLGERFGPFVKNGQSIDIWNADGGTASEQAYKNIPFYLSSKGYGIFVNNAGRVSFEIASEKNSRVQFSVPGESLEYFVIYGADPKAVLERYTALIGRPALPPPWTFGLWLSTSFTTSYDEETVMRFIDGMAERGIPLAVFHFDCFWMRGFHWCDFTWDSAVFPDPAGLLRRIKSRGLKICVWINPYIAQLSPLFNEGKNKGYFIRNLDGSVFQSDLWQAGMAIVDFTNPAAAAWYTEKLEVLLDMGVDCFKTDFGERIPVPALYHNKADAEKMHNYYAFLYNKAVFELLERKRGPGEACVFARAATAGGQRFPVHWGGDCESTFEAMAETLRGGLSLGLCGFGFWSHDIGGFEGTPDADLFKRWLAFGLLSSHSRLHGSSSYRVPWNVDEESAEVCRFFTNLKESLLPYLLDCATEAHEKGLPVLRAMFLEFPEDPACAYLDRQYMLGPNVLVAPVFSPDGFVSYYLPAGDWTQVLTGEQTSGGGWRREQHGYFSLPLWKRAQANQ